MIWWGKFKKIDSNYVKFEIEDWNERLKNEELHGIKYEIPIREGMLKAIWFLFGHILRVSFGAPIPLAIKYQFQSPKNDSKYPGTRRRSIILVSNNRDIK